MILPQLEAVATVDALPLDNLDSELPSLPAVAARNSGAAFCVLRLSKAAAFLFCNHLGQSGLEHLGSKLL